VILHVDAEVFLVVDVGVAGDAGEVFIVVVRAGAGGTNAKLNGPAAGRCRSGLRSGGGVGKT
jgi:hypothetical protein